MTLYYIVLHCIPLHCILLHCIVLYIILYYTVLYYIVLYIIVYYLHYIALLAERHTLVSKQGYNFFFRHDTQTCLGPTQSIRTGSPFHVGRLAEARNP
jgi:hypothetical protein